MEAGEVGLCIPPSLDGETEADREGRSADLVAVQSCETRYGGEGGILTLPLLVLPAILVKSLS